MSLPVSLFVASVINPKPATGLKASLVLTGGQNNKLCLHDSTRELHNWISAGIFIIVQDFDDSSHIFQPEEKEHFGPSLLTQSGVTKHP